MKGFIVYSGHKNLEDKTYVQLFGRLENGESFVIQKEYGHYFFIKEKDYKKIKSLLEEFKTEETELTNFDKEKVMKISGGEYSKLNKLASAIHKYDLPTYEADLKPQARFFIDNDLLGPVKIDGDYIKAERVDRVYENPNLSPAEFVPKLKTISIDIEANKKTGDLFCIGIYSEGYKKAFIISKEKVKNAVECKNEEDLLEKFKQEVINIDPDIITGWHVIDFDLKYLKQKFDKHKINFDIGRTNENAKVRIEDSFFRSSTADVPGRQVLDGLNMIKDPFIKEAPLIKSKKFSSYALENISQEILSDGKIIKSKGKEKYEEIENLYKKNKDKLVEYNLKDCELAYNIMKETAIVELAVERASLTGMPLNKITASIASFDSLYIREARKRKLVSPTTRFEEKGESIRGGYVMDSVPGIYDNVAVLDFKSLYPSIIKTFNIDPAAHVKKPNKKDKLIESPNKAHFINNEGILPEIIGRLHAAREKAKKEKRQLASYAIKIIQNSFFGVLASPNCRYFSLDMANAITHFGQFIIKLTAEEIEKKGFKVIYSDTDSVFVETKQPYKEAEKTGRKIEEMINNFYKKYVKEKYDRHSYLELEFEKLYASFMLPPVRSSEKGSKKRYAGMVIEGDKEKIEIVGLEAIRGDWTEAAQDFQVELLKKIFHRQKLSEFIRAYVKKIREGKMDDKLVYRKSITKPLDKYTKTTPPHVKAARKLDKLDSKVIQYYITLNGPEPVQKLASQIDYDHYVQKQIAPIADTLLSFFGQKFEDIIKDSKQSKLF